VKVTDGKTCAHTSHTETEKRWQADHVEGALELHVIGLTLQLVVPVRQGVVPPLQHYAGRHGTAARRLALGKRLQHHCSAISA